MNSETNPQVTVSIGVSYWSDKSIDKAAVIFKRADEALYKAKRLGKNRAVVQEEDRI